MTVQGPRAASGTLTLCIIANTRSLYFNDEFMGIPQTAVESTRASCTGDSFAKATETNISPEHRNKSQTLNKMYKKKQACTSQHSIPEKIL